MLLNNVVKTPCGAGGQQLKGYPSILHWGLVNFGFGL